MDGHPEATGIVYILEFSEPMAHARHYIGYAESIDTVFFRIKQHKRGQGANITRIAVSRGIKLSVVMFIPNCTRADERRLKNLGGAGRAIAWGKRRGYGTWP